MPLGNWLNPQGGFKLLLVQTVPHLVAGSALRPPQQPNWARFTERRDSFGPSEPVGERGVEGAVTMQGHCGHPTRDCIPREPGGGRGVEGVACGAEPRCPSLSQALHQPVCLLSLLSLCQSLSLASCEPLCLSL